MSKYVWRDGRHWDAETGMPKLNERDFARDAKIEARYNQIGNYAAVGREFGLSSQWVRGIIARNKRDRDVEYQAEIKAERALRKLEREKRTAIARIARIEVSACRQKQKIDGIKKSRPLSERTLDAKLLEIYNLHMRSMQ